MTSSRINTPVAIMFTDIVGYSSMIAQDEKGGLALLDEHNSLIFPIIKNHNGEIIKLIGDAIFARFSSSENSVIAALEIQNKLHELNKLRSKNKKIIIRIGLHVGEVIEKDNDLFGHDVNLGSRIEGVTEPGSISISQQTFESINDDKMYYRKIGYVKLKNIPNPQLLYKIYLDLLDYNSESDDKLHDTFTEKGIQIVDIDTYEIQKTISIAVLNFNNLGEDSDQYFLYNFTKDIISSLQDIKQVRVSSINDVTRMKKTDFPLSEIARRLEVNILVNGSIMKRKEGLSIELDMISTDSGSVIWSENWETDITAVEKIKNQIVIEILEKNEIEVPNKIQNEFAVLYSDVPEANDEYQKARFLMDSVKKKEELVEAKRHLENSIKYDPLFLYPQSQLGWINHKLGYFEESEKQLLFALKLADQDGTSTSNSYVYHQLGILYNLWGKYNKSCENHKLALEILVTMDDSINQAVYMHNLATSYKNLKQHEEAIHYYSKSLKIKQEYENRPMQATTFAQLGQVYHQIGKYTQALSHLKKALAIFQDYGYDYMSNKALIVIAEIYVHLGFYDKAEELILDAKDRLEEFEEPVIIGHVGVYQGIIEFNKSNVQKAFNMIQSGIEQFQMAQKQVSAYEYNLLYIQMLLLEGKVSLADNTIKKISTLEKQIENKELKLLAESIKNCINVLADKHSKDAIADLLEKLESSENETMDYFAWWYLALSYARLEDSKQIQYCFNKAQDLLKFKAKEITNESHREGFLTKNILNQKILNSSVNDIIEYTSSLKSSVNDLEVAMFCSQCGYKNKNKQPFCPGCGQGLKVD